jgi:hypothetical protein
VNAGVPAPLAAGSVARGGGSAPLGNGAAAGTVRDNGTHGDARDGHRRRGNGGGGSVRPNGGGGGTAQARTAQPSLIRGMDWQWRREEHHVGSLEQPVGGSIAWEATRPGCGAVPEVAAQPMRSLGTSRDARLSIKMTPFYTCQSTRLRNAHCTSCTVPHTLRHRQHPHHAPDCTRQIALSTPHNHSIGSSLFKQHAIRSVRLHVRASPARCHQ